MINYYKQSTKTVSLTYRPKYLNMKNEKKTQKLRVVIFSTLDYFVLE